jgi:hypothetical protein
MKNKEFDCVLMKERAQQVVRQETQHLTREEVCMGSVVNN